MDEARHDFFANAAFAGDEDGRVEARDACGEVEDVAEGRAPGRGEARRTGGVQRPDALPLLRQFSLAPGQLRRET
jgi:hypothetical protein